MNWLKVDLSEGGLGWGELLVSAEDQAERGQPSKKLWEFGTSINESFWSKETWGGKTGGELSG